MKNVLLDKGIILPSGEISKDKVNLVTGAITQPFAEMVWVTTGGDMETVNRLTDVLVTMNTPADRGKLFKIIKMLYGLLMKAVEAGDPEAIAEYERKLALQRERNHRRQQKIKEAREADPAYIAQMEEKERLQREKLLEAERKRTERANRQKKLSRKELKEAAKTDPKAAEEWQALKEKEAVARQRKKEREEERMAADPEYAAMMAERKAEYTRTRTAKRQAEREALVELAKTDEEAAKKLAEMRKYQSQATVRSYQKMKADAEAGDPDAIKRYETTLAKRREEYHRKKGA